MFQDNLHLYPFVVDQFNEASTLSLTCRLPETFPGSGLYGDQVLRRVNFSVETSQTDNSKKLVLTQMPILFATNSQIQPYRIELAQDVKFFVLEFWDPRLNEWTDQLLTTNVLPRIVRVTLAVGQLNEKSDVPKQIFARTVAIPSTMVTRELQIPRGGGPGQPPGKQPKLPKTK
jgi:hypothetical protein